MNQNTDFFGFDKIQPPQYPVLHHPSQKMSEEFFQAKGNLIKSIQTFKVLLPAWEKFFAIQHAQPEDTNKMFQKLLEDLQIINEVLAEYINYPSWNRPTFYNDDEKHSVQYKEYLKNSSNAIAATNFNQEKEEPPQNSDIRQLIREEALNSKLLSINLRSQRLDKEKQSQISPVNAIAPVLPTEEPEYALSMGFEHLSTIPETESDEVNKSSVKNLVPIPSKYEILSDSNNDDISSDDDAFEDIEYVEASKLVSLEEENVVYQEEKECDLVDILQIQDVILREKLLSINRLIADIEFLNDNPTSDHVLKSSASFPIFEKPNNSLSYLDNSLPEFETFSDHTEETRSDPLLEKVDLFLALDNSIPPGIENIDYDSEGDIHFIEELLVDDSIPLPKNESSNFDHHNDLSFPRPPSKPPDVEVFFDFEPHSGELIAAVMNNIYELNEDKCFDPWGGKDIANITKKWSKLDKNKHEIVKNAQKPDSKTISMHKKAKNHKSSIAN
nr:hypothetical protein [Tanacetum cinerariifolium]